MEIPGPGLGRSAAKGIISGRVLNDHNHGRSQITALILASDYAISSHLNGPILEMNHQIKVNQQLTD